MDDINLGLYPRSQLCPLGLTTSYMTALVSMSSLWSFSGQFFTCVAISHPPPAHTSRPPTPSAMLAQNWCASSKNDLKLAKIKHVTNSKLYYNIIKFNVSISAILLNTASLTRAKAGYTNCNF